MPAETKLWLAEFLFTRRPPRPDGRPLYAYRVSDTEYLELQNALRTDRDGWRDTIQKAYWAACFAMYASESYRRRYDSNAGWSWASFEAPLGVTIPVGDRSELVKAAMGYWKRPIRRFESGNNDYLGSLFAEGGLPWTLLSSEHAFGRAVKSCVRNFDNDRESGRTPTIRIAEAMPGFPQSFRTEDVCFLLAGIVTQIIQIVTLCRLQEGDDALFILDRDMPSWRENFPIPLDDNNANQLVRDWLTDASRARADWKLRKLNQPTTCSHRLSEATTDLGRLTSIIDIQKQISFPKPALGLSSTRLEIMCFEGERLTQRVGVAYAEFEETSVRINVPKARIELQRENLNLPLTLKVLASGTTIHTIEIPGSAIDTETSPSIFEFREDGWYYLSSVSCQTKSEKVLVRIPDNWDVISGTGTSLNGNDAARWVEAKAPLTVAAEQEEVCIDFSDAEAVRYRLAGTMALTNTRPFETFMGWPRLVNEGTNGETSDLLSFVNGKQRTSLSGSHDYGAIRYLARNERGLTIFKQQFGLLPTDFKLRRIPARAGEPARIIVSSKERLSLTASVNGQPINSWDHIGESSQVLPETIHAGHADITLAVRSKSNPDPLTLKFPFPYIGVQITNAAGDRIQGGPLTLDDILGMDAILFAGPGGATTFRIVLQLISGNGGSPQQYSSIRVGEDPVTVKLNSFTEDVAMLLGVSTDQDAQVRMSFESNGTEHLVLRVGRYKYVAALENQNSDVCVTAIGGKDPIEGASIAAMCIPTPSAGLLPLTQTTSHGVKLGFFRIPEALQNDGPWILCAPRDALINFRPRFLLGSPQSSTADRHATLANATRIFHPEKHPKVLDEHVEKMALDASDAGWDYLRKLRDDFSHLPLSAFEVWKAVAGNSRALIQAVLRLELTIEFCRRLESELAVIWEAVPLQAWRDALDVNTSWLKGLGLPESLQAQLQDSGIRKFKQLWPGFEYMEDYLHGKPLRTFPFEQTMTPWHMALRRQQAENDHWPTQCGRELRAWVMAQPLPDLLKNLPGHNFMSAVTYLPIFLGCVSAGRSPLELPNVPTSVLKHAVRHIANFDRQWFGAAHALMTSYFAQER